MNKAEHLKNLRTHGKAPFTVTVIHGGLGAGVALHHTVQGGEMAGVARELASGWGVLEPLQRAVSLH